CGPEGGEPAARVGPQLLHERQTLVESALGVVVVGQRRLNACARALEARRVESEDLQMGIDVLWIDTLRGTRSVVRAHLTVETDLHQRLRPGELVWVELGSGEAVSLGVVARRV